MICNNCGTQLPDNAKFCGNCGTVQPVGAAAESAAAAPEAAQPTLRKGRAALVIGIGAVAAAALVAGSLFLSTRAGVRKVFMGEERYARSVFMDALGGVAGTAADNATAFATLAGGLSAMSDYDDEEVALAALAMGNSMLGTDGVTFSSGVNITPSDLVYSALSEQLEDTDITEEHLRSLVQEINGYSAAFTEKTGEDAYEFSAVFGKTKDPLFKGTVYYADNGDAYITFPDATKSAVLAELPELPDLPDEEGIVIDYKQIAELAKQLEAVFDEYYDDADVEVKDRTIEINGAKFDGLCSEIVFEADDMHDMLEEMIEILSDNDYLADLLEDNIEDFDYEDALIAELENFIYGLDEADVEFAFRGYVNGGNKLCGVELLVYDDDDEIVISALNDASAFAVGLAVDTQGEDAQIYFNAEKVNKTDGTAAFEIKTTEDEKLKLNFEYSGVGMHKTFGGSVPVGTVKLLIDDDFIEIVSTNSLENEVEIGGKTYTMKDIMEGAAFTLGLTPDGKGIRLDAGFECEKLGSYSAYVSMKPASGKVASGKFSDKNIIDADDITEDEGIEFAEEVAFYYAGELLKDPVLSVILNDAGLDDEDDLIEAVTGGYDVDEYIERNFGDGPVYAAHTIMSHPVEY